MERLKEKENKDFFAYSNKTASKSSKDNFFFKNIFEAILFEIIDL